MSTTYGHTLSLPVVDNIKPTVYTFDTTYTTTTTSLTVSWTEGDNIGVTSNDLYLDGTYVTTVGGGFTTYTFSGLQPNTGHILGLIANDAAGNASFPMSTTYGHTLDTATHVVIPQMTLVYVAPTTCSVPLNNGGGYNWINAQVTNATPNSIFEADYYYQGVPDNNPDLGVVNYIDQNHVQVRAWVSYLYEIHFKVKNPGGLWSDSLQTQIVDCGLTALTETPRDSSFTFKAGSNLIVNDEYKFELNQEIMKAHHCQYEILNLMGQIVKSGEAVYGDNSISLSGVSNGLYLFTLRSETSETFKTGIVKKIMKLN